VYLSLLSAALSTVTVSAAFYEADKWYTMVWTTVRAVYSTCQLQFCLQSAFSVTFAATVAFMYINWELVLLVTAHVSVTHEKQSVAVSAGRRRNKLQPNFCLLLQRQPLYRHEIVHLYISDDNPPSLLAFLYMSTHHCYTWNNQFTVL